MSEPFSAAAGPRDARVMFIGEAWGESEERLRTPLCGYSGREFFRMLFEVWSDVDPEGRMLLGHMMGDAWVREREAWLGHASFLLTNTFNERPPNNNLEHFMCSKKELPENYCHGPIKQGKYIRPEYLHHVERLKEEIAQCQPNLVVALGNTALWAVLGTSRIGALRGTISTCQGNIKVLPTYHPAAVCRNWAYRPIVIADLLKAKRESAYPDLRRPRRMLLVNPTVAEIEEFFRVLAPRYAVDIETEKGQIEMIGFAESRDRAIVIPFVDWTKPGRSYWETEGEEQYVWDLVARVIESPDCELLYQNGLYDLQYIWRIGITPRRCTEDTMLLHHALHPEMQKGLAFLGSVYTNEPAWKLMRSGKHEELKREA